MAQAGIAPLFLLCPAVLILASQRLQFQLFLLRLLSLLKRSTHPRMRQEHSIMFITGHGTHRCAHNTERFGRWGRVMAGLLSVHPYGHRKCADESNQHFIDALVIGFDVYGCTGHCCHKINIRPRNWDAPRQFLTLARLVREE